MSKKASSAGKILVLLIFVVVIALLVLLTKNKGNFSLVIADIKNLFGK